jgi:hypothetical protein
MLALFGSKPQVLVTIKIQFKIIYELRSFQKALIGIFFFERALVWAIYPNSFQNPDRPFYEKYALKIAR